MVGVTTLNRIKTVLIVVTAVCAAVFGESAARANQIPGVLITGRVTSVSRGDWINIDGHSYHIPSGSPAAATAPTLSQGQLVDVRLTGSSKSASSEVISIAPHQGQ
jgi:hypothetical protein